MAESKSDRVCVFCGMVGDLTLEHTFPRWLGKLFPSGQSVYVVRTERAPNKYRTFRRPFADVTVKEVCGSCNNGWMRVLEETIKPILTPMVLGSPSALNERDQDLLALWVAKTSFMCDHVTPPSMIPKEHLAYIYANRHAPDDFTVWLTRSKKGRPRFAYFMQPLAHPVSPDEGAPLSITAENMHLGGAYGYCSTMNIGHFTAQLFWSASARVREAAANLKENKRLDRIWPTTGQTVVWPTSSWRREDQFDRLWRRFYKGTPIRSVRDLRPQ